jgi:hypothetical protein
MSRNHPDPVMSGTDLRSRKRQGGFWGNQSFKAAAANDQVWVGSRHGSDRAADGRFARLLKISCQSAIDPLGYIIL